MIKGKYLNKESMENLSDLDIADLLKKVREFQEENKKYLIPSPSQNNDKKTAIFTMTNTSD